MSSAEVAVGPRTWDTGTFGRMIHRKIKLVEIYRMVKSVSLYLFRSRSYKAVNVVLAKMNAGKWHLSKDLTEIRPELKSVYTEDRMLENRRLEDRMLEDRRWLYTHYWWSVSFNFFPCLRESWLGKNDVIIQDGASSWTPLYTHNSHLLHATSTSSSTNFGQPINNLARGPASLSEGVLLAFCKPNPALDALQCWI